MTDKIKQMLENLRNQAYKALRAEAVNVADLDCVEAFRKLADAEEPVIFENDSLGFNRHTKTAFASSWGNVTPNYARIIKDGFDKTVSDINAAILKEEDGSKQAYGRSMLDMLEISTGIADRYREEAKKQGNERLYRTLLKIPQFGAESLYEALVFMKFCIFVLRLAGVPHLTIGRFDQYMYPFYENSKKSGASEEELFELIEEFFISINYDTDLYYGIQQGDNGQSMVLGGYGRDGRDMFNELSKMCMDASLELSLIDPKINLRVAGSTPKERYEYATLLTKKGLGFPQYCNDDVVVPGLIKLGYAPEDAYDYTVAACWEYIVPNCSMDIPNLVTMNFPKVVNEAVTEHISACDGFEGLMEHVRAGIARECDRLIEKGKHVNLCENPLLSVFIDGCIQTLTDAATGGGKYMNFGCHGAGIANAADALAAVKKLVYDEKTLSPSKLKEALLADFEGYLPLRSALKNCPKMGNNDDYVDSIAADLMDVFSVNMNNRENGFGGIYRAGTGSAQEYIHSAKQCPATCDGRRAGEAYSSSFSPSLEVRPNGLLSVISSFTKYDMTNIINGGPLTIEVHDSVLRNDIGVKKVAALVKHFIEMGGHQLQINSVNREVLLDAKKHPEKYPNLIVRVWGWSGYFNELDPEYQNHIIKRCEFTSF